MMADLLMLMLCFLLVLVFMAGFIIVLDLVAEWSINRSEGDARDAHETKSPRD